MQVLKVVAEGLTTSFRRPHFMWGVQPTFRMPPPATIYGHICSALGDTVAPEGIAFAYHFTALTGFSDVEHTIIVIESDKKRKLKGTDHLEALQGSVQPFKRELLFRPRLVLYINRPEWLDAFRHPRYAVVLGRSQDLFRYSSLQVVELRQEERAYFEHTLLPYDIAVQVGQGFTELLPRYLDYENKRTPTFARYLLLENRLVSDDLWIPEAREQTLFWVDPTSQQHEGAHLGLVFHTFVGGSYESLSLA
ncbi:MAG TPA: CRISPR-associated protein Cas5 [Ktedonobacteraceae bacterium]|nr:CRISPR-associated protein Cas5 [Ktedonobacteraceae bacterium]